MAALKIYHGSDHIIESPKLSLGKKNNDYGQGFYCTGNLEMAKEWACRNNNEGIVNEYVFETDGLCVLNLLDGNYNILNWIALLLENRSFDLRNSVAKEAKDYIIKHFALPLERYDLVIGYRADDSYFSYAQTFVSNSLSLRRLNQALRLGKLGVQEVLVSDKAFYQLKFVKSESVNPDEYFLRFSQRDKDARARYFKETKNTRFNRNDIFVMDIIREGRKNDDPRIQRIIPR